MQDLKQTRTLFDGFFSINKILLLVINVVETSFISNLFGLKLDKGHGLGCTHSGVSRYLTCYFQILFL